MPTSRIRLAVLVGMDASLSPMDTAAAAVGLADPVYLVDARESTRHPALRAVAAALGQSAVVDFDDVEGCTQVVRSMAADRVISFVDRLCGLVAAINGRLGVTADRASTWGMKDAQRAVLRQAGVSPVPAARVTCAAELRRFLAAHGLPAILKPVGGASSRDVWPLHDPSQVADAVCALWPDGSPERPMLVERFLVGDARAEPHLADYVSAEIFRCGGRTAAAFVTDRLRLMAPCRETGLVLPSSLPPEAAAEAIGTAQAALDAVGAADGAFHVELKPRANGSQIVELNGRLGGFITRLAAYGAGADLGAAAIAAAIGRPPQLDLIWRRCVLVLLFQPPARARGVSAVPSRSAVTKLPGVIAVDDFAAAGIEVDWRDGSNGAVARVWLGADSADELRSRLIRVAEFLTETFVFVGPDGARTTDWAWIDELAGRGKHDTT
jgi:biotin carboxylase